MITQSVHSHISLPSFLLKQLSNFIHTWHMDEGVKDKTFLQILCFVKGKRNKLVLPKGSGHSAWPEMASQHMCIGRATRTSHGSAPATPRAATRPAGPVKLL